MADQDQNQPAPWPRLQYPWVSANPDLASRNSYAKRVEQELGAYNARLSQQYGRPIYTRTDGTNVIDFGKSGSFQRKQKIIGQPGPPEEVDYPLKPLFERSEQLAINPWQNFGDTTPYNPADGSVEARLKRAALVERYDQTHDVDPSKRADLVALESGDQTMGAIANDLAKLRDSDINTWAKLGASVVDMGSADLRKFGINPAYQDLLQNIQRAQANPYFTKPTTGAPPNPLQGIIANGALSTLLLGGGNAIYNWLADKPNLTQLRTSLPADHNKVRLETYNMLANDPNARWTKGDVDYVNKNVIPAAEKEFGHGDDPYTVSKPIEEPQGAPEATQPATQPSGTPAAEPAKGGLYGQGTPATLPDLGKMGAAIADWWKGMQNAPKTGSPWSSSPPPAPVNAPTPSPAPSPGSTPTARRPIPYAPVTTTSNAAPAARAIPVLASNDEYDQLNPGDSFIWAHDGNTYAKT
jgi:hypothetical protein